MDGTGLYYYNARYYDPTIGRFISADTFVQYDAGFDVVSSELTVNLIPTGLGKIQAPKGNYPSIVSSTTLNPQTFNRYSYCYNNPLKYTDPYGWWFITISINISGGLLLGGSINVGLVYDGKDLGGYVTSGAGEHFGVSFSGTGQIGWSTNADDIYDIEGSSNTMGGSAKGPILAPVSLGIEYTEPLQGDWSGWNLMGGVGAGTPEGHIMCINCRTMRNYSYR